MDDFKDSIVTTLDKECVIGIGCKLHTHHKIVEKVMQPKDTFTIFGTNSITMYASDTIQPSTSAFLQSPKPENKIIIKPRTEFSEYQPTMDAPIMGLLLTFTIYLTAQWAWSSMSEWSKLFSELKQCLRFSS